MINFLKNHSQHVVVKLALDPSLKKIKIEDISGSTTWRFIQFVFILSPSQGLPKHIETNLLTTCYFM